MRKSSAFALGLKNVRKEVIKRHEEAFGDDRSVYCLECNDDFLGYA